MTVKELINILKKAKDIDIADVTFCVGEKTYELESIGQFGIIPDVNIHLKEVELPMMRPIKNFRRDKRKMVESTMKKIKKDLNS
jgi:hypothetical protein